MDRRGRVGGDADGDGGRNGSRRANSVGKRECWKDRTDGVEGSRFGGDLALVI